MRLAGVAYMPLAARGVIALTGADAVTFLDNLATNDLDGLPTGAARFAALLTPQGKIAFEFFALRTADGFLLDTPRATMADFIKRLSIYRLRAKVIITDASDDLTVGVCSDAHAQDPMCFPDPRDAALGFRLVSRDRALHTVANDGAATAYQACRVARGVPDIGVDYVAGDTFPHEANYDRLHGVSFKKGCFVGQEVVARMQNKSVVRRRVVRITGTGPLQHGRPVMHGTGEIGRIGSVDGCAGLALLRLDRALEARDKGEALMAGDVPIAVEPETLDRYKSAVANKPVIDL